MTLKCSKKKLYCCIWWSIVALLIITTIVEHAYWRSLGPCQVFNAIPREHQHREVASESELLVLLTEAVTSHRNLRVFGSGWSWNPAVYPSDGGFSVALRGELSAIGDIQCFTGCSVTLGGGALVKDLVPLIVAEGLQSSATGACLNSDASQTMGGLIATNVHDSIAPTFADTVVDLRVAHFTPNGTAVVHNYRRGDDLFGFLFGTAGRLGIITRATLSLEPLSYWGENGPAENMSNLVSQMDPAADCPTNNIYYVNGKVGLDTRCARERTNSHPWGWGGLKPATSVNSFSSYLKEGLYIWDRQLLGSSILKGTLEKCLAATSKVGQHNSHMDLLADQHIEMEMMIPQAHASRALQSLQIVLKSKSAWAPAFVCLRQISSTHAPMAPSAGVDVIAVNVDLFYNRDWDEFARLQKHILSAWRHLDPPLPFIRLHPGKFVAPSETLDSGFSSDVMSTFYNLVDSLDPNAVFRSPLFAQDAMPFTYNSHTPAPAIAIAFIAWAAFLTILLASLGLCWKLCWKLTVKTRSSGKVKEI